MCIRDRGKGVSAGVGVGPLYFYRRATAEIKRYTVEDTDTEWHRFKMCIRDSPYSQTGGLQILWGNIAPDGCVVKRSAVAPEMQHNIFFCHCKNRVC